MTHPGELFGESPMACPFLALELDRDRRSDKPDSRHRCFAEPTPQPRAIAHQEAYCLSSNFAACPIFQGWAMRAAARPVPAPSGLEGRKPGASPDAVVGIEPAAAAAPAAAAQSPLPQDVAPIVPAVGEPWPSDAFTPPQPPDAPRQLEAFDAAAPPPPESVDTGAPVGLRWLAPSVPPLEPEAPAAWSSTSLEAERDQLDQEQPAVPGFLAGRERQPLRPRSSRPDVQFREKVTREDLIPSWDLTSRYGAQAADDRRGGGGDRFGGLVTAVAVVAILGLGVAAVIFLPGLLGGGHAPTPTPAITAPPTVLPSGIPTPAATPTTGTSNGPTASPSGSPQPTATPHLYRIKAGDQLAKIARRFHVSVADILAANPQITNQDQIQVGQLITIPPRTPKATPTPAPTASP